MLPLAKIPGLLCQAPELHIGRLSHHGSGRDDQMENSRGYHCQQTGTEACMRHVVITPETVQGML